MVGIQFNVISTTDCVTIFFTCFIRNSSHILILNVRFFMPYTIIHVMFLCFSKSRPIYAITFHTSHFPIQETQLLPPLHPSSYTTEQTAEMNHSRNGSAILLAEGRPQSGASSRGGSRGHHSPLISTYPVLTDEEEGDSVSPTDEDLRVHRGLMEPEAFENGGSETTSSLISEALSNHFERANGTLRPRSKPNNILLPANTTLLISPHSPPIHKAQIV